MYSKLDLRAGYHQIPLAADSRNITTFATHKGLRRYTRLNFGTNSASEMFQHIISELLHDIPGAMISVMISLVFGKDAGRPRRGTQSNLSEVSDNHLTLNKSKCKFNRSSISFFGFVFSKTGISPDPKRFRPFTT